MKLLGIQKLEGRKKAWRVRYEDPEGKSRSKHFEWESDARKWAGSLSQPLKNVEAGEVTADEVLMVREFRRLAAVEGVDPVEFARNYLKSATSRGHISVEEAYARYMEDIQARNLRPSYVSDTEYVLGQWVSGREELNIAAITEKEVTLYLQNRSIGTSDSYRETIRRRIISFLNYCVDMEWSSMDTKRIKFRSQVKSDRSRVGFLSAEQVAKVLDAVPAKIRPGLAVAFFCGVRPKGELMRLRWDHVDWKRRTIRIEESVSKIREFRMLYNLPDNLWEWIDGMQKSTEKIIPITYRNLRARISAAITPLGIEWPADATRHSFATHAFHRGLEWSLDVMGHRDSRLFMKRYKGLATPEDAAAYFAIIPKSVSGS